MAARQSRNHMLNVRLSEREYSIVKQACEAQGWHSLSDFARAAVMNQADLTAAGSLRGALLALDNRMAEVAERVVRLVELLEPLARKLRSEPEARG